MRQIARALIVCAACLRVGAALGAPAAAFPLVITALIARFNDRLTRRQSALQLVSHLVSATGAYAINLASNAAGLDPEAGALLGCTFLLLLQVTALRHPPSVATGGGIICGAPLAAAAACAGTVALVLIAEELLRNLLQRRRTARR